MAMLDGVRVVELGTAITAPLAAMLLADMGADVIKVERPGGDPYRQFPRMSPAFAAANRNKRSMVCDIRGSGRDDLLALLADADVFIENMRPASPTAWASGGMSSPSAFHASSIAPSPDSAPSVPIAIARHSTGSRKRFAGSRAASSI